jgi:CRP-like cAMP-binding protein
MYLLLEGEVRSFGTQTGTGKEINYALYAPGDVFGYITMLDALPHSSEAEAKSDIKYVEISRESMDRLNRFYPRICSKAYRNLARILGNQQVVSNWILSERGGN